MPDHSLVANGVSVFYGPPNARATAVDDVSLRFEPGTLTLIMGPSGSGKTTLLSLLGALLRPDRGQVYLGDTEISALDEDDRTVVRRDRIGFIFQAFRLLHSLSALDNVLISKDIRGERSPGSRSAAVQALSDLGLGGKLNLKPKELSGGEQQRVAIARTLLGDPKVLLADEPTASLDSVAGAQICGLLRKLSDERQYTTVVVSHDPRWTKFADRVVTLQDGRVVGKG